MLLRNSRHLTRGLRLSRVLAGNHYALPHGHHIESTAFLVRFSSYERNKVEDQLRMLIESQQRENKLAQKPSLLSRLKKIPVMILDYKKIPGKIWALVKHELIHTWNGLKLFFLEARLSFKYARKLIKSGGSLSRKERQQLIRTLADLFRLVPFSVFIIVPMMEVLLPIYIKIFPKMMPSTFQKTDEEKQLHQLKAKVETAKFLQDTLEEIALIRKDRKGLEEGTSKAYEFSQFLKKVREGGGYVTNADLFKYIKLFEDELTLDNLSMTNLRALCRLMGIPNIGSPELLRFYLQMKLRGLKADDRLIAAEGGPDVLTVQELQAACRARGMRAFGMSEDRLREQLKQWLELSLDDQVPPSLLLLSRAMFFPEELNFTERLRSIIGSLPDEVGEHTTLKLKELEGITDPKARIDLLKSIEQSLRQENEQEKLRAKEVKAEKALEDAEDAVQQIHAVTAEAVDAQPGAMAKEAERKIKELKAKEKLDPAMLESLENLLHGSAEQEVKHDIEELKEKVIEHSEDLMEINSLVDTYQETTGSKRLRKKVHKLISKVDTLAAALENRRRELKETIADPSVPVQLEAKKENLVQIKDLIESLAKLQQCDPKRIEDTLVALDADVDGKVERDLVLEVLEMLSKHKDVEISAAEMARLVELLKKEDLVEELEDQQANGTAQQSSAELEEKIVPKLPVVEEEFPVRSMAPESVVHPPPSPPFVEPKVPEKPSAPPP